MSTPSPSRVARLGLPAFAAGAVLLAGLLAPAADDCDCLSTVTSGRLAYRMRLRWVTTSDFSECVHESAGNLDLAWGDAFQTPEGLCGRRTPFHPLPEVEQDCGSHVGLPGPDQATLTVTAGAPGACFPGTAVLDLPFTISTPGGMELVTPGPIGLSASLEGPRLPGIRLVKGLDPVPLLDRAMPGGSPAGFILDFEVALPSCDCPRAETGSLRWARLEGAVSLKLYGIDEELRADVGGHAILGRQGGTPFQEQEELRCSDSLRLRDLRLTGTQLVLGELEVEAPSELSGQLVLDLPTCAPGTGTLSGGMVFRLEGLAMALAADLSLSAQDTASAGPFQTRLTLPPGVIARLHRLGDPEAIPLAELISFETRVLEVPAPPCLPPEGVEDLAVALSAEVGIDGGPPRPVVLDGLLRLRRGAAVARGGELRAPVTPLELSLSGRDPDHNLFDLTLVPESTPEGELSLPDSSGCDALRLTFGFVPRLMGRWLHLVGKAPLAFTADLKAYPRPGDRFTSAAAVELVDASGGERRGELSAIALEVVSPLISRAVTPARLRGNAGPERLALPVDFPFHLVDLEVEVDLLHPELGDLEVLLAGPRAETPPVPLFRLDPAAPRGSTHLRARFADQGRPFGPPFHLGETIAPVTPRALAGIRLERGDWALEVRHRSPPGPPTVIREVRPEFIARGSRGAAAGALEGLSVVPVLCASVLSWSSPVGAEDLLFFRNGRVLGPEVAAAVPPFFDPDPPLSTGLHQYAALEPRKVYLRGVVETRLAPIPPVEWLALEESGPSLRIRWSSPIVYDSIRIDLDGEPVLPLIPGAAGAMELSSAAARGRLLSLTGLRCRRESEPRFRPLLPEVSLRSVSCQLVGERTELSIDGAGPYESLRVLRDEQLIALLPGGERSFSDLAVPLVPGQQVKYCVEATYESGRKADQSCCTIRLPGELQPVCAVQNPQEGAVVFISVTGGEPQFFERVIVVREDLKTFEMLGPSYVVRDDRPPAHLADRGVNYFLTSRYQGLTYPTGRCLAHVEPPRLGFVRGDCNGDASLDLGDALAVLWTLFAGGEPACRSACNADGSGEGSPLNVDLSDAIHLLGYLFLAGPPPAAPFPSCGSDLLDPPSCRRQCN